jgi:hypothetical protein
VFFLLVIITTTFNIENTPNYQHTISNAAAGLHDDGKTGGILNSWGQYAKSGDIIFAVAGAGGHLNALSVRITCDFGRFCITA